MAFCIKLYMLAGLLSLAAVGASPVSTADLPIQSPNIVKDPGFTLTQGSPWKYTGSISRRRTGSDYVVQLGPGSVLGYAELTIPAKKTIYPRIAQDITLPGDGYYTLKYDYTIASFGNRQNCVLQTGVGNTTFGYYDSVFDVGNVGDAITTYEAHYGFKGTYPLGLSFFLYCDNNPGVSMFLDNIELRLNPPDNQKMQSAGYSTVNGRTVN